MKNLILIFTFITSFGGAIFAQNQKSVCFSIVFKPPTYIINDNEMPFSIEIDEDAEKLNLKYEWKTDLGKINKDQNSEKIVVDVSEIDDTVVSATVKIIGLPENCQSEFSGTGIVSRIKDYFPEPPIGSVPKNQVKAEIDNLFIRLENAPKYVGYLITYGKEKEMKKRENLIKNHIKYRGYNKSSVIFLNKIEDKEIRTEVYFLPPDVSPPTP